MRTQKYVQTYRQRRNAANWSSPLHQGRSEGGKYEEILGAYVFPVFFVWRRMSRITIRQTLLAKFGGASLHAYSADAYKRALSVVGESVRATAAERHSVRSLTH